MSKQTCTILCDAFHPDDGRHFVIVEETIDDDGDIYEYPILISIETIIGNIPQTTAFTWYDRDAMLNAITWHDWIVEGVMDKDLKKQINIVLGKLY